MTTLPKSFDLTPIGDIVECVSVGEPGYADNVRFELTIHEDDNGNTLIGYYGEDDTILSIEDYFNIKNL